MVELNGTLLIQILNFIILVAILGHFAYKPIIKVLDARKQRIQNDLDSAAASKADAAKLKDSYEEQLRNAQAKAQEIVTQAVKEAKVKAEEQIEAAHIAIEQEKENATKQIERERKDALDDLKAQVAVLSCDIAAKIISKNMTPEENGRIIEDSITKLGAVKSGK
ncbi:F0F1 ATP synthase subunit B [Dialister micraerophilus]|uniref:F0F1 ATP synthase subunit B n=1 Tax=Dialister micraerophilus TaxID=309120 RepID=UPI0023F4F27D|nr:F0F1 ATP synthase subunit B [Dialister micraerophilus]